MMMKERLEPGELKLLRILKARAGQVDESHFWNLEKGYLGELLFDEWFSSMDGEWIVVNDLLLEHGGTLFQIDSLVIGADKIYLFEVKNFEGDYYIDGDKWFSINKFEIKSPLLQLQRCETTLRQLLRSLGFQSPIESTLIFINPEFTLYNCSPNLPIVFYSQMNRYTKKLLKQSSSSGRLNARHTRLAEKLCELHVEKSPYDRLPEYRYDELRKGIVCAGCGGMGVMVSRNFLGCRNCSYSERVEIGILRSIKEYMSLFNTNTCTSKLIYDWCGMICSKKMIKRILGQNYILVGHGKSACYVSYEITKKTKGETPELIGGQ
ncbi:hypothetical protein AB685_14745 [Bacillus sp. LL01]|nr:hypothetical protein AB685_14745 [Bacillus sp. LL01]